MVELRWIKMFLFLFLGLQFTAVTEQSFLYITVRDGDEATLSCNNVMTDQDKCDGTTWLFIGSRNAATVALIELGQIVEKAKAKSDRLSLTADCSLVIKKVTVEDVGQYTCRQFDTSGQQQGQDSRVDLSVVSMTERKDADEVKLNCSVSTYDGCRHTVKWLYKGSDLDIKTRDRQISQSTCSVTVVLLTSHFIYTSNSKFLKCNVTDLNSKEVQLYNFSPQSSGEATTTEPETTATPEEPSSVPVWWFLIFVVLAALIVAAVVVAIRRKKTTGNTQMIQGLSLNPAVTQSGLETSQDTVDPEEGVSYASIRFTEKTNSKTRVRGDDDDGDAVTYSTVQASSSSAGASTDPSNLYATVNKPTK